LLEIGAYLTSNKISLQVFLIFRMENPASAATSCRQRRISKHSRKYDEL